MKLKILSRERGILKLLHPDGHTSWGYCKEIGGKKYRTSGWSTRKKAEAALEALKLKHHMIALGVPPPPEPVTYKRLCSAYLIDATGRGVSADSVSDTKRVLDRFESLLPRDVLVTAITAEHFRQYRTIRRDAGRHPHSIAYELKRLRTVMLSAQRLFELNWNPPRPPEVKRVHKGRTVILSEQQIGDLLAASKPELRDLLTIGLHTALRIGEILSLNQENVDFSAGVDSRFGRLRIISEKNAESSVVPLTQEASAILRRRLETSQQAFSWNYKQARSAFEQACKRAGVAYGIGDVGGATLHTLRHSATSFLLNRGTPLNVVQMITRHTDQRMVLLYAHAQPGDVGRAIASLGRITKPRRGAG